MMQAWLVLVAIVTIFAASMNRDVSVESSESEPGLSSTTPSPYFFGYERCFHRLLEPHVQTVESTFVMDCLLEYSSPARAGTLASWHWVGVFQL